MSPSRLLGRLGTWYRCQINATATSTTVAEQSISDHHAVNVLRMSWPKFSFPPPFFPPPFFAPPGITQPPARAARKRNHRKEYEDRVESGKAREQARARQERKRDTRIRLFLEDKKHEQGGLEAMVSAIKAKARVFIDQHNEEVGPGDKKRRLGDTILSDIYRECLDAMEKRKSAEAAAASTAGVANDASSPSTTHATFTSPIETNTENNDAAVEPNSDPQAGRVSPRGIDEDIGNNQLLQPPEFDAPCLHVIGCGICRRGVAHANVYEIGKTKSSGILLHFPPRMSSSCHNDKLEDAKRVLQQRFCGISKEDVGGKEKVKHLGEVERSSDWYNTLILSTSDDKGTTVALWKSVEGGKSWFLSWLAVDAKRERNGYPTYLLHVLKDLALGFDVNAIYLEVGIPSKIEDSGEWAGTRKFYQKLGFVQAAGDVSDEVKACCKELAGGTHEVLKWNLGS